VLDNAAGYAVFTINPKAVDRYRHPHRLASGKNPMPLMRRPHEQWSGV
jgi:hypothetical protein